jgi:hypothetical protein
VNQVDDTDTEFLHRIPGFLWEALVATAGGAPSGRAASSYLIPW